MPFDNRSFDIINNYQIILGELQAFFNSQELDSVVMMGDFNASPTSAVVDCRTPWQILLRVTDLYAMTYPFHLIALINLTLFTILPAG